VVEALIDSEIHYLFTNDIDYKENNMNIVQPSSQENLMPTGDMRGHEENGDHLNPA
jgi:hypothetical protein